MKSRWLHAAAIVSLILRPAASRGETQDPGLEFLKSEADYYLAIPVRVASTKAEGILKTVSTVTVIDRRMIQDFNFQTVSDAVNTVAGFEVIRTPFMKTVPMSRGILQAHYANKTLILIDNVPSWLATTGEGFLDRVDVNDVERIEVLKGPASVLYGSNAYSGVVNIILKSPQEEGSAKQMHATVGSEQTFGAGGSYSARRGRFSLFVSGNSSTEEGRKIAFVDELGERGEVNDTRDPKGGNFTMKSVYREHSLLFNGYRDEFTSLEGSVPSFAEGAGKPSRRAGYLGNYTFSKQLLERLDLQFNTAYDWNMREFSRLRDDSFFTRTQGYRWSSGLKTNARLADWLSLELGGEYEYRWVDFYKNYYPATGAVDSYSNIHDRRVYEYSGFSQAGMSWNMFRLQIGARMTHNEFFGDNLSSRGTLLYLIDDKNSLKLIAGQSYRAPSVFEQFILNASRSVVGSTSLSPETSNSLELAYMTSLAGAFIQLLGYEARYFNKIERHTRDVTFPDGVTKRNARVYENGDSFKARGLELEVNYRNPRIVNAFTHFSYIASDDGQESNFRYVPDFTVASGLARDLGNFFASAVLHHRSKTHGRLETIRGSTSVDASVGYQMDNGKVRHAFTVENVTDEAILYPEYVRQTGPVLNQVPSENRRRFLYTVTVKF